LLTPLGPLFLIDLGYGGFSISMDPFFSPTILTFLQKYGAIFALPNIRGGGEFGEAWHKAGANEKKVRQLPCSLGRRMSADRFVTGKLF